MATIDLREYARRGAAARLAELNEEIAAIYNTFPDLRRDPKAGPVARTAVAPASESSDRPRTRRRWRRPLTDAEKRAIGLRMKRWWASQRKEK